MSVLLATPEATPKSSRTHTVRLTLSSSKYWILLPTPTPWGRFF